MQTHKKWNFALQRWINKRGGGTRLRTETLRACVGSSCAKECSQFRQVGCALRNSQLAICRGASVTILCIGRGPNVCPVGPPILSASPHARLLLGPEND